MKNPPRTNFDTGLFKRFEIKEEKAFEFRAEAFNVFNHTQWSGVNTGTSCFAGTDFNAGDLSCLANNNFLPERRSQPAHPAARPEILLLAANVAILHYVSTPSAAACPSGVVMEGIVVHWHRS
jgi:hypothetical protein